ncbi:MAG: DUF2971 domain-containing protein [Candidatus Parabeggiatoa sp.]|nr:DUF2971 domain-containing protein [Candidatus Parabeggiatoa sp.]
MDIRPEFFEEPMLRATPLSKLNDPFEGTFTKKQIEKICQLGKYDYDPEYIANDISREMEFIPGIVAFSMEYINPIMWSHYAAEHRGMVIQFKKDILFGPDSENDIDPTGLIHPYPQLVSYCRRLPKLDTKEEAIPGDREYETPFAKFNRSVLLTKSIDWCYEQEMRSVFHLTAANKIICNYKDEIEKIICDYNQEIKNNAIGYKPYEQSSDNNRYEIILSGLTDSDQSRQIVIDIFGELEKQENVIHLFQVNPESIKGVYFGCKSDEKKQEECIAKIIKNKDLNLSVYRMEKKPEDYSLTERKYDKWIVKTIINVAPNMETEMFLGKNGDEVSSEFWALSFESKEKAIKSIKQYYNVNDDLVFKDDMKTITFKVIKNPIFPDV